MDHFNDPKTFIEYSNDMHDVYKNTDKYNVDKDRKILIVLMIWLLILLKIKSSIQWLPNCLLDEGN